MVRHGSLKQPGKMPVLRMAWIMPAIGCIELLEQLGASLLPLDLFNGHRLTGKSFNHRRSLVSDMLTIERKAESIFVLRNIAVATISLVAYVAITVPAMLALINTINSGQDHRLNAQRADIERLKNKIELIELSLSRLHQ